MGLDPVDFVTRLAEHGGLAAVCMVLTWIVWRQHNEQRETISTYLQMGRDQGVQMERNNEHLERIGRILQTVEQHMGAVHFCPVSQVSSETLRRASQAGIELRREDVQHVFASVVESVVAEKMALRRRREDQKHENHPVSD